MKIKYLVPLFTATLLLLSASECEFNYTDGEGILKGKISIGPLCPVERDPPDPACLPTKETYEAYPVGVWTANGRRKIADLKPSLDGRYNITLQPGAYLVRLENANRGPGGTNLPVGIKITQDQTTSLDIDIDTGIR